MPILSPLQTWSIIPAEQLSGLTAQRALIVGQQGSAATATSRELQTNLELNGEDTLFGATSHLAEVIREFRKINKVTPLDIIPLDDDGEVTAAEATLTFAGTATANGSMYISFASKFNYRKKIDIVIGDTATLVGAKVTAAFAAETKAPFTVADALGVVTATAENGGTLANNWSSQVEGTVAGITYTLVGWAGGATDPDPTDIFDVIGNTRYNVIIWPEIFAATEVETLLNDRFNTSYRILDGMAIQTKVDSAADLITYANQNSQSYVVIGNKEVTSLADRDGSATMEMPDVISAHFGAWKTLRLTENTSLTNYLSSVAASDQFGSLALASLPYFNTRMPFQSVADPRDEFTLTEQAALAAAAVSVIGPNRVYNETILGQMVTTYLTDAAGNSDDSYKFVEVVETASVIREFFYENCRSRYAQTRLTDGDLISGRDMANESSIRAFLNRLYDALADNALVQAGRAAKKDFNQNLSVSVDVRTGTVTIAMAPLLVTQLRVILGTIQINFGG